LKFFRHALVDTVIINTLSDGDDDHCNIAGNTHEDALRLALNSLRSIEGTMVMTYTFDPFVGMTSQTDPAGHITYYEYDDFNRLEYIRNQDFNIMKKFNYHYKSENDEADSNDGSTGNDTTTYSLAASVNSINVDYKGEESSFILNANINWTLITDVSWISLTPISGKEVATISYIIDKNSDNESRVGYIIFSSTEGSVKNDTVVVTQSPESKISVSPQQIIFTSSSNSSDDTSDIQHYKYGDAALITVASNVGWTATTDMDGVIISNLESSSFTIKLMSKSSDYNGVVIIKSKDGEVSEEIEIISGS